jgi:hypothetical protein
MRRVAQMFEGMDLLVIRLGEQVVQPKVLNLSPVRLKIIHLDKGHSTTIWGLPLGAVPNKTINETLLANS